MQSKSTNINEELRKLQSYGFSRKEVIENLQSRGVSQNIIDRNIDLYFKPVQDVKRRSFSFRLILFLLIVISSIPLIGVIIADDDYGWLFLTIFLWAITFGFYRLWNFALLSWAIVLGLLLALGLFCLGHCLVYPHQGGLSAWDCVGILSFLSMLLGKVIDFMKQRRRFLKEME